MSKTITGTCPKCGVLVRFRRIGTDLYQCGKCGKTTEIARVRIRKPQAEKPVVVQREVF